MDIGKARYGTQDAPQTWSVLCLGVCCNGDLELGPVTNVDVLLRSGMEDNLQKGKDMLVRKCDGKTMDDGHGVVENIRPRGGR